MWWDYVVGGLILLAMLAAGLWGVYGDKLSSSRKKRAADPLPPREQRKEPVFTGGGAAPAASGNQQQTLALDFTPPPLPELEEHWQAVYCYVARFYEDSPHPAARFIPLQDKLRQRHLKVYRLLGLDEDTQQWGIADSRASFRYWLLMLPLADRSGSLSRQRIKLAQDDCRRFAEHTGQRVLFPDLNGALERAKLLDRFCNEVDIVLNLRLVFEAPLQQDEAEELLQRSYLVADNGRYAYRLDSELLFAASVVMLPNNMVREIVFTLDAPKVSQPQRGFEDMIQRMSEIADLKPSALYDRRDKQLTDTDISVMRGGVELLVKQMNEKGVTPGSTLAHLLFS